MARLIKADLDRMIDDLYNKMYKVHRKHNEDMEKHRMEIVKAYVATKSADYQQLYERMCWISTIEDYILADNLTMFDSVADEVDEGNDLRRTILYKVKSINKRNKSYEEVLEEVKKKLVEHYKLQQ